MSYHLPPEEPPHPLPEGHVLESDDLLGRVVRLGLGCRCHALRVEGLHRRILSSGQRLADDLVLLLDRRCHRLHSFGNSFAVLLSPTPVSCFCVLVALAHPASYTRGAFSVRTEPSFSTTPIL